jgi:hypothetical protein
MGGQRGRASNSLSYRREIRVQVIAKSVANNGRDLEGALNRLLAVSKLTGHPITLELAERESRDLIRPQEPRKVKIEEIQRIVARRYNVSRGDQAHLLSGGRSSKICPWQKHHAFLIPLKVGVSTIGFALSRRAPVATMSVDERIKPGLRAISDTCGVWHELTGQVLIAVNVDRQLGYKFCALVSECPRWKRLSPKEWRNPAVS